MTRFYEEAAGLIGDLGGFLSTDLLTSPIRRLINRDAERAGIEVHNPHRSVASLLGSSGMSIALGSVLGPPGGILGGLLGYVAAIGSEYEGDLRNLHNTEETAQYLLELKAFQAAAEVLEDSIPGDTWAEICEEIQYELESISIPDPPESLDEAVDLIFEIVSESIALVDFEAYSIFTEVYEESRFCG